MAEPARDHYPSLPSTAAESGPSPLQGLDSEEAARRLARDGENALEEQPRSILRKLLSFFWGPIPWMIETAAVLSAAVQQWDDFSIIVVMLLLNASVGFFEEHRADNAIDALKQRLAPNARVLRDGHWSELPARLLVRGDVVLLKLGNIVPADVELRAGDYLTVDQSALTGESLPVDKKTGDSVYSGSIVHQGEMRGVVTATGMDTFFGKTARLVESAQPTSHFQKAVLRIGNFLILMTAGLVGLILIVALFRESPLVETLLFALILTVAAIPVALPAVLSVTMAVGASRLARMKAIVSRLVSIEEMAGLDVLCADKTGTLTKNQLTVAEPVLIEARDSEELFIAAALTCEREAPDPIDGAILAALGESNALEDYEVEHLDPFDPVRKRALASVRYRGNELKVAKGAPQVIMGLASVSPADARRIDEEAERLAARGMRTLGVARSRADGSYQFLGLLSLVDPPRDDSAQTIATAQSMGLSVRMVTGDHRAIAREISTKLGLGTAIISASDVFDAQHGEPDPARIESAHGFAEVFPEHKFNIVRALQRQGHIVGMTGDGVNDAPALKQADVGIAVSNATDAARAAADLVLTAPGLSTITRAVEESRRIFERMTSYSTFRITETVRVLLFMTLSILVFDFYPVTAVMIVMLAILNDFPILMIAYDNVKVAPQPVRWDMRRVLTTSTVLGTLGVVASFGLFWIAERRLGLPRPTIQTLIFLKLLVAGHLTLYVTRNDGWFWQRPWPSWRLFIATEATQLLGTLAAVYGWFVEPIGWTYALAVWGYALAWLLVNNAAKVLTYRTMHRGSLSSARHIARSTGRLQSYPPPSSGFGHSR